MLPINVSTENGQVTTYDYLHYRTLEARINWAHGYPLEAAVEGRPFIAPYHRGVGECDA